MSEFLQIHPHNPQGRLISKAVEVLRRGGVIVYPTDSCYALGCQIGDKAAQERIRRIRAVDDRHHFTLVCRDLSELANYARVDNIAYRILKSHTPGPYTFLLKATHEVPRRLQVAKRKSIGLRVPDNIIVRSMLEELGEPILSSTLILPDEDYPESDLDDIRQRLDKRVDLIIDGGYCGLEPTTVVDLYEGTPTITRVGLGAVETLV